MKLPILLLLLAALGHAARNSRAKSSVTKQKDQNQTGKRELYEGNFGERNKELLNNYAVPGNSPKIEYAKEIKEMLSDQSAAHQIFGVRLPHIAKISDVLSGQSPSFEAAVAKHLYSPISVYHARLSSPTSFEVPITAPSQLAYPAPKVYKIRKGAENEQRLQEIPPKDVNLPSIPLYTVKQPKLRFESYPQPLDPGFSRQYANLPQEIFRPQQLPRQPVPSVFPIYDQLEPIRYQGHIVPSEYLNQNGIYQFIPINSGIDYGNQEGNRGKDYPSQESHEELKAEPTERPQVQNEVPVHKQGYHAHPNGAISFASFSQNLPVNTQYEITPQPQSEKFHQPQPVQLPPPPQPIVTQLQSQEQTLAPGKPKLQYSPIFHKLVEDLHKYQPDYQPEPQFITFKQVQNQPSILNALRQHFLYQNPRQLSDPRVLKLQRLPAFKPLPQSQPTTESFFQQTSSSPIVADPKPFISDSQSKSPPSHIDQPIAPVSPQRQLTPLPPLKPNYSKYVKPLKPRFRTTSVFLPTTLQTIPTSTPKEQPANDQLISSTTLQPDVKNQEEPKEQSIQTENQLQSQTSQSLEPEIIHQSQPKVLPLIIQPTTYRPFAAYEAHSDHYQHSTPQPEYQSAIHPQSIQTSPRHDVIIQQQEIQELIFEPSQPSSTPHYQQQQTRQHLEQEAHQLQSHEQHQLFEQLEPLQFQQELQELQPHQYRLEARQSESPQKQYAIKQLERQKYSYPLKHHQFQPKQLQNQQLGLEQSQQQGTKQTQPQQYQQQSKILEPNNEIQVSTATPSQEPESQAQLQQEPKLQPTTEKLNEKSKKLPELTPNSEQPYMDPIASPVQSLLPQVYAPQQLIAQPIYSSIWGVSSYPDMQYFGKFAEALFANRQQ